MFSWSAPLEILQRIAPQLFHVQGHPTAESILVPTCHRIALRRRRRRRRLVAGV